MAVPRTLDDARAWVGRVAGLVAVAHECQDVIQELRVRRHLARKLDNPLTVTKWQVELAYMERQLRLALDSVREATGRATLKEAWELVADVRVRGEDAVDAHEEWRRAVFARDTVARAGQLELPEDRATADASVAAALAEFEAAVAEACRLIPPDTEMTNLT